MRPASGSNSMYRYFPTLDSVASADETVLRLCAGIITSISFSLDLWMDVCVCVQIYIYSFNVNVGCGCGGCGAIAIG